MTYRALLSKLLYALFTAGLCAELLLALAARDALRWGQRSETAKSRRGVGPECMSVGTMQGEIDGQAGASWHFVV